MRILMFGMSSYPGGIENYIYNLFVAESFPAEIQIDFITYEPEIAYETELLRKGYRVYRVPHLKKNPPGYFREVKKLIKDNQYDAVYVNMLTAANVLPIYLASVAGVKTIILHAHANSTVKGALRKSLHRLNKNYCNKKATLRLACSEQAGKWLFEENDFTVIANAIDAEKFRFSEDYRKEERQKLGINGEAFVLGHIGRIAPEKNHGFMLAVLKEVLQEMPAAKLVFVGDGGLTAQVKEQTAALGLQESVIFYGTSDATYRVYSAFDAFLFPSTFEGFGMAALEAQACGLPCYCSDCLSPELNVSGTVRYLSLEAGAAEWARVILAEKSHTPDREIMNRAIQESPYNVEQQINVLVRKLNEQ